ncbi:MAG: class I SAM-dependent methyltransferase [Alistipes sp.]
MLDRAVERVSACSAGRVTAVQRDVREADLGECRYDIVLSGAALHHLRGDEEWLTVFARLYRSLRPGGCLMISDLVAQQTVLSFIFGSVTAITRPPRNGVPRQGAGLRGARILPR